MNNLSVAKVNGLFILHVLFTKLEHEIYSMSHTVIAVPHFTARFSVCVLSFLCIFW